MQENLDEELNRLTENMNALIKTVHEIIRRNGHPKN